METRRSWIALRTARDDFLEHFGKIGPGDMVWQLEVEIEEVATNAQNGNGANSETTTVAVRGGGDVKMEGRRLSIRIFVRSPFFVLRYRIWFRPGLIQLGHVCRFEIERFDRAAALAVIYTTSPTMSPKSAPYGTWHSPITSDAIVQNVSKHSSPSAFSHSHYLPLRRSGSPQSSSTPSHPPSTTSKLVPAKVVDA